MKVQGTLSLEGVKLHVRIEAPDDQTTLYVTNVHPNCLVIPKERWRVEFLGLPPEVVEALHSRNITFLGQLVDAKWRIGAHGLNEEMNRQIGEALRTFLDIALVFDLPPKHQLAMLFSPPKEEDDEEVAVAGTDGAALNNSLACIGLSAKHVEILQRQRGATTLGDLLRLGRNKLLMTSGMDTRAMERIEAALRQCGHELTDTPQTPVQSS